MILEKILKTINNKDTKKLVAKKPDHDFIPYVCHFDPNTIITKNGELLQVIRITGFGKDSLTSELISLRDTLRDAIVNNIPDEKFAFWFHTIRRKKNIVPEGEFTDFLSKKINDDWVKKNAWDQQYVNELYITIITEGLDTSIMNFQSFSRSFSYSTTQNLHKNFLTEAHKKLTKLTISILAEIEEYGGKLLAIEEDEDGILYSKPMRFFGKIINLYNADYPITANDISDDLASHNIAFGNRELEVIGEENKNFAAILSIKEYHEVGSHMLDKILQLPFEFIITQSFDFSFDKKDLEPFEYQNYILQVSQDEDFRQIVGAANFVESNKNKKTDYGRLQTTLKIISSNIAELEKDVMLAIDKFSALGFVLIREDVFLEHCFWSQLPGNFAFLRRQKIINTSRVGGFSALHSFPAGQMLQNHWGSAITNLKTVLNTPYFFNFHDKDLGNTLIIGPKGNGKTVLTNFLLAQSISKVKKIFYFDLDQSSKTFIKGIGGAYYRLDSQASEEDSLKLNPFSLENTPENIKFLSEFILQLLEISKGEEILKNEIESIQKVVEKSLGIQNSNFPSVFNAFNTVGTKSIYKKLSAWGSKELIHIFSAYNEIDWKANKYTAFDLSTILEQKEVLSPVIDYLLYRVEMNLDGSPSIIVFDEAWKLFQGNTVISRLPELLKRLREKNCIAIFVSQNFDDIATSAASKTIMDNIATQIYLPAQNPQEFYKTIFDLNEDEVEIISMMDVKDRNFLLKHSSDSIIATLDFEGADELPYILSSNNITIAALEEVIASELAEKPDQTPQPQDWIPKLIEVLKEFDIQKKEEERKAAKEKKIKKEYQSE